MAVGMSEILPTSHFCHSSREFACEGLKRIGGARIAPLLIYVSVRELINEAVWRDRPGP